MNLLKGRTKCYVRDCDFKEVTKYECDNFVNEYQIQKQARYSKQFGLYFNGQLVQVMAFGKPRYNKKYDYQLIRYCSSYNIVGGAEKLFKNSLDRLGNPSVVSYCDNSKFNGSTYQKLGFKLLKEGKPSKHWYNISEGNHITDNYLRKIGYDKIFGTDFGKGTSNEELMLGSGYLEIYDCGQSTYIYGGN